MADSENLASLPGTLQPGSSRVLMTRQWSILSDQSLTKSTDRLRIAFFKLGPQSPLLLSHPSAAFIVS